MKWLPITTRPLSPEPRTALFAEKDADDGEFFLRGIYLWRGGQWVSEETFQPITGPDLYYLLEDDLIADLAKVAA